MEEQDEGIEGATKHFQVSACMNMCVFLCLCLYIPSGNRVASSCPWVFIDTECGICWVFLSISLCERAGGSFVGLEQGHMVAAATMRLSEAALARRQGLRMPPFYKDTASDISQTAAAEWRAHFHNTTFPREKDNSS